MRVVSNKKVTVRETVIGGDTPLVCLPLVAKDKAELLHQARELFDLHPDLFEWRIDYYDAVECIDECLADLKELRRLIESIPLILTCRIHAEGGHKKIDEGIRQALVTKAMQSGHADLVDVELCNTQQFLAAAKAAAGETATKLIFSFHDFERTPDTDDMVRTLARAEEAGAHIAKIAVMPRTQGDVLRLLEATWRARSGEVTIPLVTMAMGSLGGVTRLAGGLFGSDITFAVGKEASAPGQIPIAELRQAMHTVYGPV